MANKETKNTTAAKTTDTSKADKNGQSIAKSSHSLSVAPAAQNTSFQVGGVNKSGIVRYKSGCDSLLAKFIG